MRSICFLLFLCLPVCVAAQITDTLCRSIGLFGETNALFAHSEDPVLSTLGIQYNKKVSKYFGYKITLGYGNYNNSPNENIRLTGAGNAIGKAVNTNIDLGIAGVGINFERPTYNKLVFFAGFEVRAGYGSGAYDTSVVVQNYGQQINPATGVPYIGFTSTYYDEPGPNASLFYFAFSPSLGLKLNFKRLCVGAEIANYFTITSITPQRGNTNTLIDFDFGNLTQRLFVQYRFYVFYFNPKESFRHLSI